MQPTREYPIRRFEADGSKAAADSVITEARVELDVNDGQLRLAMLCLPRDLEALAVGFLVGEGAVQRPEDLHEVKFLPDERKILATGDFDADVLENIRLRWAWGTSCGGGGTSRDMDAPARGSVGPGRILTHRRLQDLSRQFSKQAHMWRLTGGVHACALCGADGVLVFAEDVGRHNAFDKVMGRAFLDGIDVADKLVLTTGRLSAEIVSKAVAARVPMLVSRAAATSLAIELAKRFGVTLVGFLRGRRLNVYTGYQRVVDEP